MKKTYATTGSKRSGGGEAKGRRREEERKEEERGEGKEGGSGDQSQSKGLGVEGPTLLPRQVLAGSRHPRRPADEEDGVASRGQRTELLLDLGLQRLG